jgi:hypothetical protein
LEVVTTDGARGCVWQNTVIVDQEKVVRATNCCRPIAKPICDTLAEYKNLLRADRIHEKGTWCPEVTMNARLSGLSAPTAANRTDEPIPVWHQRLQSRFECQFSDPDGWPGQLHARGGFGPTTNLQCTIPDGAPAKKRRLNGNSSSKIFIGADPAWAFSPPLAISGEAIVARMCGHRPTRAGMPRSMTDPLPAFRGRRGTLTAPCPMPT